MEQNWISKLLFVAFTLLFIYGAHAENPSPRNDLKLHWFADEPILALNESALMIDGLYNDFLGHKIQKNHFTSSTLWYCRPTQIHLSLGKYSWSSMTVSFTIQKECIDLQDFKIDLFYGTDLNHLHKYHIDPMADRVQYDYTAKDFPYYQSGSIFHAALTNLEPSQKYLYQITVRHNSNTNFNQLETKNPIETTTTRFLRHRELLMNYSYAHSVKSPLLTFRTSHLPQDAKGTKMAIVADLGQTYNSTVTMYHMYKHTLLDLDPMPSTSSNDTDNSKSSYISASIILCSGDMSYSDTNQKRWDRWFDLIEPLISEVPIQVLAGNHEVECDVNTYDSFTPYETRFAMPSIKPAYRVGSNLPCDKQGSYINTTYSYEYGNSYYAFTQGLTRVIMLNSYSHISKESEQYQWLVEELEIASANRRLTPWIMVMVHVPLYNTFSAHQDEETTIYMLEMIEPLFIKHRVNLVMSGHAHGYSRSTNVEYGEIVQTAPIYITVGEGGNREQHSKSYRNEKPEDWIVKRDITEYGFGTLEFLNATNAHWKWVRNELIISSHFTDEALIKNQYFL